MSFSPAQREEATRKATLPAERVFKQELINARSVGRLQGHSASILQLLVLGERLLSLGADRRLLVWAIGEYGAPEVPRPRVPAQHHTQTCALH